ncbi:MAG: phospholipase D-like domain-containing protein [Solirubrobacteraceae bacterium]
MNDGHVGAHSRGLAGGVGLPGRLRRTGAPYAAGATLYIHAKTIRIDQRLVFLGSQNLSRQSLLYNRELGIITQSPQIVASVGRTFGSDFIAAQPYRP